MARLFGHPYVTRPRHVYAHQFTGRPWPEGVYVDKASGNYLWRDGERLVPINLRDWVVTDRETGHRSVMTDAYFQRTFMEDTHQ